MWTRTSARRPHCAIACRADRCACAKAGALADGHRLPERRAHNEAARRLQTRAPKNKRNCGLCCSRAQYKNAQLEPRSSSLIAALKRSIAIRIVAAKMLRFLVPLLAVACVTLVCRQAHGDSSRLQTCHHTPNF